MSIITNDLRHFIDRLVIDISYKYVILLMIHDKVFGKKTGF